jgi:hypothetical protein
LVFALLRQARSIHKGVKLKTDWFGFGILCPSGAKYIRRLLFQLANNMNIQLSVLVSKSGHHHPIVISCSIAHLALKQQ